MLAPNNNRGMIYQTNEKHFTNLRDGASLGGSLCNTSKR
jgi:hypothetical protein